MVLQCGAVIDTVIVYLKVVVFGEIKLTATRRVWDSIPTEAEQQKEVFFHPKILSTDRFSQLK